MTTPSFQSLSRNPIHLAAFGFGAGLAPRAPGTAGTLVGLPIVLVAQDFPLMIQLAVVFFMTAIGVWICQRTADDLAVHDHPGIVWDEMTGYLLTMVAAPPGVVWLVVGFALFRLFDIWKPWPIGWLDKHVNGGAGIMVDDLVAAIYALVVLQILVRLV